MVSTCGDVGIQKRGIRLLLWKESASNIHQAHNELDYYDQLHAAELLDAEELRRIEINAGYWRARAVMQYQTDTLYFQQLTFDRQSQKHLPRLNESKARIIARSMNDAVFFPELRS